MRGKNINVIIGRNIRLRRSLLGLSQERLGARLGITFQQVQKYEKGTNSVSPERLVQLGKIFGCGVGELFLDASPPGHAAGVPMPTGRTIHLVNNFERIRSPAVQKQICDLVRSLADRDDA